MSPGDIWPLVAAVAGVLVAALFAAAESAFSRVSRFRAEEMVAAHRRGAVRVQQVVADPARYLNLLQLLRVAGELIAAVLFTTWTLDRFDRTWQAVLVAVVVMVVVSYVVIGVTPRTLGRQHADKVALAAAPLTVALVRVFGPISRLLILLGNAVTPGKGFREGPFASEAELREMVDLAEESALIESDERAMIHSVFELGDTIAREVMVPRTDIVFIERTKTLRQAMSLALRSGFSRIPVVGENEDDVVGIVYLRDLAQRTYEYRESEQSERVESVMRPATFVPDSKPVDELMREMQARRNHVVIVVDEYGGTAGLVTIEDILEEIVGEIADEHDQETPRVEDLADGSVRVTARLPIEELGELFGVQLEVEDIETVGGLLAHDLGRVPIPGASVAVGGLLLTAEASRDRRHRIGTVLVRRAEQSDVAPDGAAPGESERADV